MARPDLRGARGSGADDWDERVADLHYAATPEYATGHGVSAERPVKQVELDALLAAPVGLVGDLPVDADFHARRLPDSAWRRAADSVADGIAAVVQLHRLREVAALAGFTRFEAVMPDINGEYDTDVERAEIALDPSWFPAVENLGEGIFLQLDAAAVERWLARPGVATRIDALAVGHRRWDERCRAQSRGPHARPFPGGRTCSCTRWRTC